MNITITAKAKIFTGSIVLLLLNDWLLKPLLHNSLTGKLSDFAGLFAFPFFFGLLFPRFIRPVHLLTALAFVVWKSPVAQAFISFSYGIGIPIDRTIDITDNIALLSVWLSYCLLRNGDSAPVRKMLPLPVLCIACFAFMATSMVRGSYRKVRVIDKQYQFPFSKRELVSKFNAVQIEAMNKLGNYGKIDFDGKTNTFHYTGKTDTLAILIDYKELDSKDTISSLTTDAAFQIWGNEGSSYLKLISVNQFFVRANETDTLDTKAVVKLFEKHVVNKIRKYKTPGW